jgi:hypothetical protein
MPQENEKLPKHFTSNGILSSSIKLLRFPILKCPKLADPSAEILRLAPV